MTLIGRLRKDETARRFVRFVLVGFVNTAFGYSVFAALILIGVPPQPSLVVAYAIGILWNFGTHARLVFYQKGFGKLPLYVLTYLGILAFNSASLQGMLWSGVPPLVGQAILAPISAVLAFILISKVLTGRFPLQRG